MKQYSCDIAIIAAGPAGLAAVEGIIDIDAYLQLPRGIRIFLNHELKLSDGIGLFHGIGLLYRSHPSESSCTSEPIGIVSFQMQLVIGLGCRYEAEAQITDV